MKAILSIFTLAILALACNNADENNGASETVKGDSIIHEQKLAAENDSANFTSIQWLDSIAQDKGKMKEGSMIDIAWRFKNVGDKPLIIISASASCGCTVAEKPEQPIAPGGEGVIKAKFDGSGREGFQNKNVSVRANTKENTYQLSFSVQVEKK